MKVTRDISIADFDAWSGAVPTKSVIIDNNMVEEFDNMIEELYPDGIDATQLNDLLWFDSDWIYETLGMAHLVDEAEE
jgi:hypothetical protein